MRKIPTLFERNYTSDRLVNRNVVAGCEWVTHGEGITTRKWDGTCCLVFNGILYKRHDVKHGRIAPKGFVPAQDPDPVTGHWPGWLRVGDGPEDRYHREPPMPTVDGTYELIGPKVNNNPERMSCHQFIKHGEDTLDAPRDYDGLFDFLRFVDIEGIVWHHPDGRMVKLKKKDFGWKR